MSAGTAAAGGATPKQFLSLGGVPILVHCLRAFVAVPRVAAIYIAVRATEIDRVRAQVAAYMHARGFRSAGAGVLTQSFSGTAGQAERAFGVSLQNYRLADGTTYRAPAGSIHVPAALAPRVITVDGLNTLPLEHPAGLHHVAAKLTPHLAPLTVDRAAATRSQALRDRGQTCRGLRHRGPRSDPDNGQRWPRSRGPYPAQTQHGPTAARSAGSRCSAGSITQKRLTVMTAIASQMKGRVNGGSSRLPVDDGRCLRGAAGLSGYCATKGGVRLFAKAIAMECATRTINSSLPLLMHGPRRHPKSANW